MNISQIKGIIAKRSTRYGSNALLLVLSFIGIVALVNILAARHSYRLDCTAEKQFTLSPQTVQILKGLREPVKVTLFFTAGAWGREEAEDLLKEYSARSSKISYEFIDPELKPALARQYGIQRNGTVVFEQGDRRQEVFGYDEQDFTTALIKVTREESKVVYFLTGHGERDPEQSDSSGYSTIKSALEKDNYKAATLNLAITDTVPADAAMVVVAAPQAPLTPEEEERLSAYVDSGGRLLLMSDPQLPHVLSVQLAKWGLAWRDDMVIDPASSFFGDVATPLVTQYPYHEITKDLSNLISFFPLARSINSTGQVPTDTVVSPLVSSSTAAWGETDLTSRQARYDEGKDAKGPLNLIVAVEKNPSGDNTLPPARAVLFGDSDCVANSVLQSARGQLGNVELFMNAVNWLAEESELISIRPQPSQPRTIILTAGQARLILYTSTIFLPLMVLALGGYVWWRHR